MSEEHPLRVAFQVRDRNGDGGRHRSGSLIIIKDSAFMKSNERSANDGGGAFYLRHISRSPFLKVTVHVQQVEDLTRIVHVIPERAEGGFHGIWGVQHIYISEELTTCAMGTRVAITLCLDDTLLAKSESAKGLVFDTDGDTVKPGRTVADNDRVPLRQRLPDF